MAKMAKSGGENSFFKHHFKLGLWGTKRSALSPSAQKKQL
jgi:hypothetical protein